jgi:Zn finger protein HypA/HybF involved in hydrogenase expression
MRHDIFEQRSSIEQWIAEHRPKAFICRELRCKPETLNSYLGKMHIEYSGNMGGKGHKYSPTRKHALEFLHRNSFISTHKLRLKLLRDKIKELRCERCDNTEWLGKPIPVELHHINGNRFDNRLGNLQMLCPNCHALTDNHAGRGSSKHLSRVSRDLAS